MQLIPSHIEEPADQACSDHNLAELLFLFYLFYFLLCWVFVAARRLFSGCGERGLLFLAVCGLLIVVASRCRAQALGMQTSVVVACGLSSCGSQALERRLSSCGTRA